MAIRNYAEGKAKEIWGPYMELPLPASFDGPLAALASAHGRLTNTGVTDLEDAERFSLGALVSEYMESFKINQAGWRGATIDAVRSNYLERWGGMVFLQCGWLWGASSCLWCGAPGTGRSRWWVAASGPGGCSPERCQRGPGNMLPGPPRRIGARLPPRRFMTSVRGATLRCRSGSAGTTRRPAHNRRSSTLRRQACRSRSRCGRSPPCRPRSSLR